MNVSESVGPVAVPRGSRHAVFVGLAVCFFVLAATAPARALTLTGPAATFSTVRCVVTVGSADPTGTVTLMRDGRLWASLPGTPGSTLVFSNVVLRSVGPHVLTAVITAGSARVTSSGLKVRVYAWPRPPVLVGIDATKLTGRKARIKVQVAADVYYADLYLNGRFLRRFRVTPNKVNDLGSFAMPSARNTIGIRLGNPAGYRPTVAWRFGRFSYPAGWSTCIVVVKSQLRLYWIRSDVLVKSYTVATGRPSMPTPSGYWRIDMKYHTAASSVSGPRKMRLFRLRGGRFVYTAYGIHGTNVDSSIGTYASHGCIRMHNRDVLELFPQVPLHTLVQTR